MLLYYQPFFFCVSHSNTPQEIGLGQFFPLQERIYLLTKFYSQVTSQKSIQLEYERGTVAQGQGVMTAAQGSRHAFGRGRDMLKEAVMPSEGAGTWQTVRAVRPGKYHFANCTEEA